MNYNYKIMNYILEGKIPKEVDDIIEWGQWFKENKRHVDQTDITEDIQVSTVFLGIDHAFMGGPPLLFETMIFGGDHDNYQERYETWEEAEIGHQKAIELCGGK